MKAQLRLTLDQSEPSSQITTARSAPVARLEADDTFKQISICVRERDTRRTALGRIRLVLPLYTCAKCFAPEIERGYSLIKCQDELVCVG